ncbi:MAG TPA: sigma-54 dependent transcriptional regulator [Longimicrobium sp.]|jgi:two-component system nitrogen regulation response regulator NtrX|uniref:sigma-54-dependent transcriptional regulator n=1 Tax=Longimicrobium sp. TaxID=2029185 RepID=UPI002ED9D5A0
MARILVVDDEEGIRRVLHQLFEYEDHEVRSAGGGAEAISIYQEFQPDVTFLDVKMARMDGLEALTKIREHDPAAVVIMISGHGTIDTAVEATRRGAFDFLEKPLDTDRLLLVLRNALQQQGLVQENARLRGEIESRHQIVGRSFSLRQVLDRVEKVAPTDARVLVTGENGTGKELVARAIHRLSPRADKAFIEVNCAAIPSELIESELFGHMKGSFTGAHEDRAGKFELADGGTLFLDEIGDMSLQAQAKVLRALQEGIVTRVGGAKPITVDVRVLAATNKDLEEEIKGGRFREDLYYRLNVIPLHVPPLRERREDISMLVRHFVESYSREANLRPKHISDDALDRMQRMDWPGNVRELRNTVERLLILASGASITADDVELLVGGKMKGGALSGDLLGCATFAEFKEAAERAFIVQKLRENDWNVSETARILDMPRSNLYKKIERYELVREG